MNGVQPERNGAGVLRIGVFIRQAVQRQDKLGQGAEGGGQPDKNDTNRGAADEAVGVGDEDVVSQPNACAEERDKEKDAHRLVEDEAQAVRGFEQCGAGKLFERHQGGKAEDQIMLSRIGFEPEIEQGEPEGEGGQDHVGMLREVGEWGEPPVGGPGQAIAKAGARVVGVEEIVRPFDDEVEAQQEAQQHDDQAALARGPAGGDDAHQEQADEPDALQAPVGGAGAASGKLEFRQRVVQHKTTMLVGYSLSDNQNR